MRVCCPHALNTNPVILVDVEIGVELVDVQSTDFHVRIKGLEVLMKHFGHGLGVNSGYTDD